MKVNDFLKLMQKVEMFKIRLQQEGIQEQEQDIILKVYITDLTNRININMLEVI